MPVKAGRAWAHPPVAAAVAISCLLGCAARTPPVPATFRFAADTFAFANDTLWEYHVDADTDAGRWQRRQPPPAFVLRCGNMARATRQFHVHARFAPDEPATDAATYHRLVAEVLHRDARQQTGTAARIVIPGYTGLRTFSAAHPGLLQTALEGPWHSYVQRGNWRMIFPFTPNHQRDTATALLAELADGHVPIVHVLRYPNITINHVVLVFTAEEDSAEIRFLTYDPNIAEAPVVVRYDRAGRVFRYPRTPYFGGGPVKLYEVYAGPLS